MHQTHTLRWKELLALVPDEGAGIPAAGEEEYVDGSRAGHVVECLFGAQKQASGGGIAVLEIARGMGELAFVHACDEHHLVLKPLDAMHRGETDAGQFGVIGNVAADAANFKTMAPKNLFIAGEHFVRTHGDADVA